MRLHIRPMTPADLPRVHAIDALSMSNPWSLHMFAVELENENARCWVADADGEVVAALILWLIVDEAHIATLAVHPDFRRRGISLDLMRHALTSAQKEGALTSLLEVRAGNMPALHLYRRLGYQAVGLRRGYYRDNGEDAVLMTLHDIRSIHEH